MASRRRAVRLPYDGNDLPMLDNHCHRLVQDPPVSSPAVYRRAFTESPADADHHVPSSVPYLRLVRELAERWGCEPTEEAVVSVRASMTPADAAHDLMGDAGFSALLADDGFPAGAVMDQDLMARCANTKVRNILRIEPVIERLLLHCGNVVSLESALSHAVAASIADGTVGLKTVIAYRSGLDIRRWPSAEIEISFQAARRRLRQGSTRVAEKPLLDHLVRLAMREASRYDIPVQVHTGYGDRDVDLRAANPLHLRNLLEDSSLQTARLVLLHGSCPFTREAAYLASVYPQVYLDLAYGIPFMSTPELEAMTRQALGMAPLSKIMVSTDAAAIPELFWRGARMARYCVSRAVADLVSGLDLTVAQASRAVAAILDGNARRLYRLEER
jgi:uncharacterized protein